MSAYSNRRDHPVNAVALDAAILEVRAWAEGRLAPRLSSLALRAVSVLSDSRGEEMVSTEATPEQPIGYIPVGRRLTLRCPDKDCWIDRVDVSSGGGTPKRAPACPNCQGKMEPETRL